VPNVQERAAENDFGYVSRYSSIFSGEESEPALMETRQSTQELERIVQQNYGDLKLTDVKKVAEPNGMSGQDAASHAMYPDEHPQAWPRGSQKTKKVSPFRPRKCRRCDFVPFFSSHSCSAR